jgi:hypothetical protein
MNRLFKLIINNSRYLFFVFLFPLYSDLQAQSLNNVSTNNDLNKVEQKIYRTIPFGEKINLGKIDDSIIWTISLVDTYDNLVLSGGQMNNHIFETPGIYKITHSEIKTTSDKECNHLAYPKVIIIKVSPIKMEFDFSTLTINKTIEGGVDIEGTELSLNVNLKSYTNESILFSNGKIESAGVGSTIKGQLINALTLKPGINKVVYKLQGSASKDTFIMLDFIDINEQVQSYYYPTKL